MFRRAIFAWLFLISSATLICFVATPASPSRVRVGDLPDAPRLLIVIIFDQFRSDYLERWHDLFCPDGFLKLTEEGACFNNCHYPYSYTVTGAGHATIGTGYTPSQHGIIGNEWYDRSTGAAVYCATLGERYRMIPFGKKADGGSPERLLVPTLGDLVKTATHGKGKVVGLSLKDRGCILPTGRRADLCLWFDNSSGGFSTSDYYAGRLPTYMVHLNNQHPADHWFGLDWRRLRQDIIYDQYSGPDDCPYEATGVKQGRVFPHPLSGGEKKIGPKFYEALYSSPFGNELLWEAAKTVISEENLGRRNTTDYLVISFSSNDAVGHSWGPDSQEVLDVTLRSDLIMADMIRYFDEHIGRENYLLALSSDHGVCPLPEIAAQHGFDGHRVDTTELTRQLEDYLSSRFGKAGKWIEAQSAGGVYLRRSTIKASRYQQSIVETAVASWFRQQPHIQSVYTRSELMGQNPLDTIGQMVKASFQPLRSGDVFPILKPYHLVGKRLTGTTHGSPHSYDTHVPLVFFGSGVIAGKRDDLVSPQLAAVVLADSVGQRIPQSNVTIPPSLFAR